MKGGAGPLGMAVRDNTTVLYLVTDHVLHTELMPLRATTESCLFANKNDAYEHACTLYVRYLPKEATAEFTAGLRDYKAQFEHLVEKAQKLESNLDIDVFELPVKTRFNPNAPVYVPGKMIKHHSASLTELRQGNSPPQSVQDLSGFGQLTPPGSRRESNVRMSTPPAISPIVTSDTTFGYFQPK